MISVPGKGFRIFCFVIRAFVASLPCTGPDLLCIDQSNRYICLPSQCTQRMETHFCLALANQEALFCLASRRNARLCSAVTRTHTAFARLDLTLLTSLEMTCICMQVCALHSPPVRCMVAQASCAVGGVITVTKKSSSASYTSSIHIKEFRTGAR